MTNAAIASPPAEALEAFGLAPDAACVPIRTGLIHDSWYAGDEGRARFLQRFADHVFPDADLVARNIRAAHRTLVASYEAEGDDPARRVLTPVDTLDSAAYVLSGDGARWRAAEWIHDAHAVSQASTPDRAYAAAFAFGDFQRRLLPLAGRLRPAIADFHDTPSRFRAFERAVKADVMGRAEGSAAEIRALLDAAELAPAFTDALADGRLPERIAHNDAKLGNLLLDTRRNTPLAIVDLDTVGPGTGLYDVGDLIRSIAVERAEDDERAVLVRPAWLDAVIRGYRDAMDEHLVEEERELLPLAGALITYEQALRFLTDHLEGDRYFIVEDPEQNLRRCRAQLTLLTALQRQKSVLRRAVRN